MAEKIEAFGREWSQLRTESGPSYIGTGIDYRCDELRNDDPNRYFSSVRLLEYPAAVNEGHTKAVYVGGDLHMGETWEGVERKVRVALLTSEERVKALKELLEKAE